MATYRTTRCSRCGWYFERHNVRAGLTPYVGRPFLRCPGCGSISQTGKKLWRDLSLMDRCLVVVCLIAEDLVMLALAMLASFGVGQLGVLLLRGALVKPSDSINFGTGVCISIPVAAVLVALLGWRTFRRWSRLMLCRHLPSVQDERGKRIPDWSIASTINGIDLVKGDDFPTYALPLEYRADY